MILTSMSIFLLIVCRFDEIESKGLFQGVPCHKPYFCEFEEDDDGFENSILIASEKGVEDEKICQGLCFTTEGCISYTWWSEKAIDHPNGSPYLCQMFSVCHRAYQNPNLTPVYSGK